MLKNNKISVCFVRCGIVLSFLALVFFASALFSVLKGNKNNLEFFGCSQKHSLQCFTSRIKQCGNDDRKDYMIEQIYINYKIVYKIQYCRLKISYPKMKKRLLKHQNTSLFDFIFRFDAYYGNRHRQNACQSRNQADYLRGLNDHKCILMGYCQIAHNH